MREEYRENQESCTMERTVQYNWGRMYESVIHKFTLVHNVEKNILTVYTDYDLKRYKKTISPYVNDVNKIRWKVDELSEGGDEFYTPRSALNFVCSHIISDICVDKQKTKDMKENGFTYLLDAIEKEQYG